MATIRIEKFAVLYVALTVSMLLLLKVFLYEHCYSFDTNDDVNHTFVNLKAAQDALRQGALPHINLYNNFGTPLLGDALTFPFALQSITYWFLPNYLAMTLNRAVIGFLTITVLYALLRQFVSRVSAVLCSLIVFFAPGQFWNLAHHHYQMSLLCACFLLYVQARHNVLRSGTYLLLLCIGYGVLFLSVSIQPVLLAIPFFLMFLPLKDGSQAAKAALLNLGALLAAAAATWPHTAAFFANISDSTRAQWSPYSGILTTTREQLLALILPPGEWMHYGINGHFSIVTYFSVAYLVFALIGILSLTRKVHPDASLLRLIVVLGALPAAAGFLLQFHGGEIPLVRSVDSTRVWWFANIFLALSVGSMLDSSWRLSFAAWHRCLIGLAAIGIVTVYLGLPRTIPEFGDMALVHHVVVLGTVSSLLFLVFARPDRGMAAMAGKGLIVAVLLLAQMPTLVHVMGLNLRSCERGFNHYFAYARDATFQPQSLLAAMEPGYRMASEESPVQGHDLKAIFGGVLGSNARAIVSSQALMEILVDRKLVKVDDNYFFAPPWRTELLSELGIRYLLVRQRSPELEARGWKLRAKEEDAGTYFVYEHPERPSLVHLKDDPLFFVRSYEIVPNGIAIRLPKIERRSALVVSFFHRDGWRGWVNGREVVLGKSSLGMIQIDVGPGDREVSLRYQGLGVQDIAFWLSASMGILLGVHLLLREKR